MKTDQNLLEFQIEQYDNNLRVGESQLICICSCLLKKSKLFLLDEVTSSLDNESEEYIISLFNEFFKDCTVLSITHKRITLKKFNKIVLFDEGRIREILYSPFDDENLNKFQ